MKRILIVEDNADLAFGLRNSLEIASYEVIVANLPYVPDRDRGTLSREVLHDPDVALFGGDRGDEIVRKLIGQAPSHLAPGGLLALEFGIAIALATLSRRTFEAWFLSLKRTKPRSTA